MELKGIFNQVALQLGKFQSHLYGIERGVACGYMNVAPRFQSHLYGIESYRQMTCRLKTRSFNRTFMELKVRTFSQCAPRWLSFNRTFMELKVEQGVDGSTSTASFNRTFMELKDGSVTLDVQGLWFQSHLYGIESYWSYKTDVDQTVSIAPLWN